VIAPLPATSVPHGRLWTVEELSIYLGIPVFRTPGGSMLRLPNWRRDVFLLARDRACISPRFRIHDLRHTAASLMIQAGYPPKMLQEILGHASITTTLDLYGHLYPGDMDRYADRLDSAADAAGKAKISPDGARPSSADEASGL